MKRLIHLLSFLLCSVLLTGCAAKEFLIAAPETPVTPLYPDEGDAVLRFATRTPTPPGIKMCGAGWSFLPTRRSCHPS